MGRAAAAKRQQACKAGPWVAHSGSRDCIVEHALFQVVQHVTKTESTTPTVWSLRCSDFKSIEIYFFAQGVWSVLMNTRLWSRLWLSDYGYDYGLWVTVMLRLWDGSFSSLLTRFHNWEVCLFNVHFESFLDPGRLSLLTYVFRFFNFLYLGWCNLGYLAKDNGIYFLFRIIYHSSLMPVKCSLLNAPVQNMDWSIHRRLPWTWTINNVTCP